MDKDARKSRTRYFREFELLIWLLIILAFFVFSYFIFQSSQSTYQLYNIFMSDVDGLIVGSPVNLMGVPVGYVKTLKIVNDDEIFVRFVIKDKSVKLPKGTIANVEFTGLGGSKSIELYPPNKDYVQQYGLDGDDYIVVARTNRLRDCWSLLYQMFGKIGSITYKISSFGEELKNSDLQDDTQATQKDVNNFLEFSNNWVDNVQKGINNYKNKMNDIKKGNKDNNHGE